MNNERDCKHGQLARSCEICELEAENAALKADRDSWAQQASGRVKDCADFIAQIEALKVELAARWLPIESAPKDETDVLVMYMHIDTQIVHNAFYASEANGWEPESIGWWTYDQSECSRMKLDDWMTPTHWMPLPKAPGAK